MPREDFRYKTELRVRFGETDLQGIVFNANYLLYVDTAQMDYLRDIGVSYQNMSEQGHDIVIVDASVQFRSPAYFDDVLQICARISEIGNSSVRMDFEIYESERLVANVRTAYVIIEKDTKNPVRVPHYIREAVGKFESNAVSEGLDINTDKRASATPQNTTFLIKVSTKIILLFLFFHDRIRWKCFQSP